MCFSSLHRMLNDGMWSSGGVMAEEGDRALPIRFFTKLDRPCTQSNAKVSYNYAAYKCEKLAELFQWVSNGTAASDSLVVFQQALEDQTHY